MSNSSSLLHFDGIQTYIEVPDSPDFSLTTTGALTVSAWIRPSTLTFPKTDGKGIDLTKAYVHWLGKGGAKQQEWVFRMYSLDNTVGSEPDQLLRVQSRGRGGNRQSLPGPEQPGRGWGVDSRGGLGRHGENLSAHQRSTYR